MNPYNINSVFQTYLVVLILKYTYLEIEEPRSYKLLSVCFLN